MKRRLAIYVVISLVLIIWMSFVLKVNQEYPNLQEQMCSRGNSIEVEGITYEIVDCKWLDDAEVRANVRNPEQELMDCEYQAMVLELQLSNHTEKVRPYNVYEFCMEGKGYTNGQSASYIPDETSAPLSGELEPQQTVVLQLPFLCAETMLPEKRWNDFSNEQFSLLISLYPEKIGLYVQ